MPRPPKPRLVCFMPGNYNFGPLGCAFDSGNAVNMTVDEYETIRLIDLEGMTQEECADKMGVARSTVQGIYLSARRKLALLLVESKRLLIQGGKYRLCNGRGKLCGKKACCRRRQGLLEQMPRAPRPVLSSEKE